MEECRATGRLEYPAAGTGKGLRSQSNASVAYWLHVFLANRFYIEVRKDKRLQEFNLSKDIARLFSCAVSGMHLRFVHSAGQNLYNTHRHGRKNFTYPKPGFHKCCDR